MSRVGIFGWGVVAPKAQNIQAFEALLEEKQCGLSAYDGFGPSNFLVGEPEFQLSDYEPWIANRFPPSRYAALRQKMGKPVQYAIGAFIQAIADNPTLESLLQTLGAEAHVYVGGGLHDITTTHDASVHYHRAQRRWDRFWTNPERNAEHGAYLEARLKGEAPEKSQDGSVVPPHPDDVDENDRDLTEDNYWSFWAARSEGLKSYLKELSEIEQISLSGSVETNKALLIKKKRSANLALRKRWNAPEPPWNEVTANVLWNIPNVPGAQISMMGKITGACVAPFAACATFGWALKMGMAAIRNGSTKLPLIGATDPAPSPLSVGTFYNARVLAADGQLSKPLTGMRGTHVAGGSVIWIVGDWDYCIAQGLKPLGMEPVGVGVSADADHIITPSPEGPSRAVQEALAEAHISGAEVSDWDVHATGTPGDFLEVETAHKNLHPDVRISARKGSFGHGMGACGGFEMTAQYLGYARGKLFGTLLEAEEINQEISAVHQNYIFGEECSVDGDYAGKLSMGVGGINACVISKKLSDS